MNHFTHVASYETPSGHVVTAGPALAPKQLPHPLEDVEDEDPAETRRRAQETLQRIRMEHYRALQQMHAMQQESNLGATHPEAVPPKKKKKLSGIEKFASVAAPLAAIAGGAYLFSKRAAASGQRLTTPPARASTT